ncbi:hypothetical protein FRX31_006905 [Thalictrum thalictroides]|uniref:Uncharacterized protein n=1 Tax=Thalictrum thalictroides TaxID=46969 RepID=A0A7J6X3Y5_THATH|nr:hypothetical protein FRX31_006905 [Thalictrum thalictroides]
MSEEVIVFERSEEYHRNCNIISEDDDEDRSKQLFVPTIKLKKMNNDSILIDTMVLKNVSLTSDLFRILEEEKLDILFENQYRTETKVAHTLQVKVQQGYNIATLEEKLCLWAGKLT